MEKKEMSFEQKLEELETIINQLETGEISLEESIESYTKAMKIVKECDEKIKSFEKQVSMIIGEQGQLEPFSIEEN